MILIELNNICEINIIQFEMFEFYICVAYTRVALIHEFMHIVTYYKKKKHKCKYVFEEKILETIFKCLRDIFELTKVSAVEA